MRDADVDEQIRSIERDAEARAEAMIRTILQAKNPGKSFRLAVKVAVAYTVVWEPTAP